VSGVVLSQTAGFLSIRWMITSDAANATCRRAWVAVVPGMMTNVTGASVNVNAPSAPAGGGEVGARRSGTHETFVTSNVATVSARTSRNRP